MSKSEKKPNLPIPTIDEFRLFIGRGAVRLPPLQAGISCVRRCGVRGISHLKSKIQNQKSQFPLKASTK